MPGQLRKAAFLDRDGVLNHRMPEDVMRFVNRVEDFHLLPGVPEAIAGLTKAGYRVFVSSNQRGAALGLTPMHELDKMDAVLRLAAQEKGGHVDAIYYCMHDRDANCDCRKPKPGLLLDALRDFPDVGKEGSFMVGDMPWDGEAAAAAGVRFLHVDTNGSLLDLLRQEGIIEA